ncbi:MAG: GH36-type glycosyl hydrolase domain-containing protein, partial [Anaerolineae bacterium]
GAGIFGLYEALDFTPDRLPPGARYAVIREYMSHHQGMILMSLVNYLHGDIMVQRMHSDPRIQSVELLLQEQVPAAAPLQHPEAQSMVGTARAGVPLVDIQSWLEPLNTDTPRVNLLSNGAYSVMASSRGGGYSRWKGVDLTRWRADGTLDPWGTWIYLQEQQPEWEAEPPPALDSLPVYSSAPLYSAPWSAAYLPIADGPEAVQTATFAHMAVYSRMQNGISSTMELTVSPDDPLEIRRVHLINNEGRARTLRLTSYGEVVLGDQAGDTRHPAYNKLFIESEFVPELNLQIFTRRGHAGISQPAVMGHMLVVRGHVDFTEEQALIRHESDRMAFIGRGRTLRNPAALESPAYLTGTTGMTLDPICSLGAQIHLDAHGSRELAYITLAAPDRPTLLSLARRYSQWERIQHTYDEANTAVLTWLGRRGYDTERLHTALVVGGALLYPDRSRRSAPEVIAASHLSQAGLWRLGISGDYPIMLLELDDDQQADLVSEAVLVHALLAGRDLRADLVILIRQPSGYASDLTSAVRRRIARESAEIRLNQRGGIFVLAIDQLQAEEIALLRAVAGVVLLGERGPLSDQVNAEPRPVPGMPALLATQPSRRALIDTGWPEPLTLTHPNGYGGFSADGREYVIDLAPGQTTPMPWSNVIGYPEFGTLTTESGSQTTWAVNSGENRLTPWSNDPVTDTSGEALYLRDEETTDLWSPTLLPAGASVLHRIRHGAGYSIYESASHGLRQELAVYASPTDPVKIVRLRLENTLDVARRITATQYVEWVLGTVPGATRQNLIPALDPETSCLSVRNPYHMELGGRTAFLTASKPLHGYTADRASFLGPGGSLARPAALGTVGLRPLVEPGGDVCGVLQVHLDIAGGACDEVYFVIGQGQDAAHAAELARRYRDPAAVQGAWDATNATWDDLLGRVQVRTPDQQVDLMLNRWLLYQSLSCRLYGRSGFYQSSGAFGFRDQLQDALAWLAVEPGIARSQILNAARQQFAEGDVLHWWHPPSGRGVRTRIADNLLWLPYVVAQYLQVTGDHAVLDERLPFLTGLPLDERERERYGQYGQTVETYALLEHCLRAIEKGSTRGRHGLPLMGTGDWNDGFNLVGASGKGESVWLAWFLIDNLKRWATILEARGDAPLARTLNQRAQTYAAAAESAAWNGEWYTRAFFDDGTPLGSDDGEEPRIDAIAQSWAVISGATDAEHRRKAMAAVAERLIRPEERLSLLFTPPFDGDGPDPGYISDYPPGVRENGGQYTHAATWTAWAFAALGDGERAGELLSMLCPAGNGATQARAERYRVEPYVIAADVYSEPPYVGRGGWTWYTGSASWAWRLGIEAVLGLIKEGEALRIKPTIPPAWDGYEVRYRQGGALYTVRVHNPEHVSQGIRQITFDGEPLAEGMVPLVDDGQAHAVEVVMGG